MTNHREQMAYAQGRDEERAAVVAWLRGCQDCEICHDAGNGIERGEHCASTPGLAPSAPASPGGSQSCRPTDREAPSERRGHRMSDGEWKREPVCAAGHESCDEQDEHYHPDCEFCVLVWAKRHPEEAHG